MTTLGKSIVKMRVEKDMNQKDLWAKAGLSQRYLSAVEHDKADPSFSVVGRIAKALGVDIGELTKGIEVKEKRLKHRRSLKVP